MRYSECIQMRNRYYLFSIPPFIAMALILAALFVISLVEFLITNEFNSLANTTLIMGAIKLINMSPMAVSYYFSLANGDNTQFYTYIGIAFTLMIAHTYFLGKARYLGRLIRFVKRKRFEDGVMKDGNPNQSTDNSIVVKDVKGDVIIDQSKFKSIDKGSKQSSTSKIMIGLFVGVILLIIGRIF